jgi:hypothetical protein
MLKKFIGFICSIPKILLLVLFAAILLLIAIGVYKTGSAIEDLLTENKKLKPYRYGKNRICESNFSGSRQPGQSNIDRTEIC